MKVFKRNECFKAPVIQFRKFTISQDIHQQRAMWTRPYYSIVITVKTCFTLLVQTVSLKHSHTHSLRYR